MYVSEMDHINEEMKLIELNQQGTCLERNKFIDCLRKAFNHCDIRVV
jgi:hypothetical protein